MVVTTVHPCSQNNLKLMIKRVYFRSKHPLNWPRCNPLCSPVMLLPWTRAQPLKKQITKWKTQISQPSAWHEWQSNTCGIGDKSGQLRRYQMLQQWTSNNNPPQILKGSEYRSCPFLPVVPAQSGGGSFKDRKPIKESLVVVNHEWHS